MIAFFLDAARNFEFFADSYIATLAIGLVVAYLGVFVVLKRIVFLGITLAQAAAAGIGLSFLAQGFLGHGTWLAEMVEEQGPTIGAFSVSTAAVAAFALPGESRKISREALLGLGYALFGGASILLVSQSALGIDELKNLLAGDVLFARGHLTSLLAGLAGVAAVHACLRKEFLLVSFDPEFARTLRMRVKAYELLLLLSLGVAVSLAIKVAGILLVFAFLSVPPIAGLLVGKKLAQATWIALAVAAASAGVGFTVGRNLPVAPTIACILVAFAVVAAISAKLGDWARRAYMLAVFALAAVSIAAAADAALKHEGFGGVSAPRENVSPTPTGTALPLDELLRRFRQAADAGVRQDAAQRIVASGDEESLRKLVKIGLGDEEEKVREYVLKAIDKLADKKKALEVLEQLLAADDANLRLHVALGLVRLRDGRGVGALVGLLKDVHAGPGTRQEALDELLVLNPGGAKLGYDALADDASNHKAVLAWEEWWRSHGTRVLPGANK